MNDFSCLFRRSKKMSVVLIKMNYLRCSIWIVVTTSFVHIAYKLHDNQNKGIEFEMTTLDDFKFLKDDLCCYKGTNLHLIQLVILHKHTICCISIAKERKYATNDEHLAVCII